MVSEAPESWMEERYSPSSSRLGKSVVRAALEYMAALVAAMRVVMAAAAAAADAAAEQAHIAAEADQQFQNARRNLLQRAGQMAREAAERRGPGPSEAAFMVQPTMFESPDLNPANNPADDEDDEAAVALNLLRTRPHPLGQDAGVMSNPLFQDDDSDDAADEPVADPADPVNSQAAVVAAASPNGRQAKSARPPAASPPGRPPATATAAALQTPTIRQQDPGHAERARSPVMSPSVEMIKAVAGSMLFETTEEPIPQSLGTFMPTAGLVHRASLGLMHTPGRLRFPLRGATGTSAPAMISLDDGMD